MLRRTTYCMREYPKVPRFQIPIVKDKWFTQDVKIIEKYDGSNLRFKLYDERYCKYYDELDGEHGDWHIGTSSVSRHESDIDNFDEFLKIEDRLKYLKKCVSTDKLLEFHDKYESPITIFAENMVEHTLLYDDDVPPLIVFDVYVPAYDEIDIRSSHPYKEEFSGFLCWKDVVKISEALGLVHARHIDTGIRRDNINPQIVGESEYAKGKTAEGYVIRNDELNRRVKVRSPEFLEMHKKIWGEQLDKSSPTEKQIAYKYATTQRIKKRVIEALREEGRELNSDTLNYIVSITVDDIWVEEWSQITEEKFNPFNIYGYVGERVEGTLSRPGLFGLPDETQDVVELWDFDIESEHIPEPNNPDTGEQYVLDMIKKDTLERFTNQIVEQSDKEGGNWVIQELTEDIKGWLWTRNLNEIKCLNTVIDFESVNEQLYDITVPYVKNRY